MRVVVIIFTLLVVNNALEINNLLNQKNLGNDDSNQEDLMSTLEQSHMGRFVLKMLSLKDKLYQVDFSHLFTAIEQLADQLQSRKDEENQSLSDDQFQYESDRNLYDNEVTEYSTIVAQLEVQLTELKDMRTDLENSLRHKNQELKESLNELNKVQQTMDKNQKTFNRQIEEFDKSLETMDKILVQLQNVRQNGFVEVQHKDILSSTTQLNNNLQLFTAKPIFYEALVETLVQMSQPSFQNLEVANRVLRLLQQFRNEMADSKNALITVYQGEKTIQEALVDQYNNKITLLRDEVIPEMKLNIEHKEAQIETKSQLLNDSKQSFSAAKENYDTNEQRWVARQAQNQQLVSEYDKELSVLGLTVNALERNGIKRPN